MPALTSTYALAAVAAFGGSCAGTAMLVRLLTRRNVLDRPNARSSHDTPKPRGGGIAVVGSVALVWLAVAAPTGALTLEVMTVILAALGLATVSFVGDLRHLAARVPLRVPVAAVAAAMLAADEPGGLFRGLLPPLPDYALTGFLWVWFVNLFNFMDGIDGITGVESMCVALGICGLVLLGVAPETLLAPALIVAAAAAGFLVWNWSPSRIFIGDVGSIPLGFLLGWLVVAGVRAAAGGDGPAGAALALVLLPAYYVADATITLVKRMLRRENILEAHRQHFYQLAVRHGHGHAIVCLAVLAGNAGLVAVAWWLAPDRPLAGLATAAGIVAALCIWLARALPAGGARAGGTKA